MSSEVRISAGAHAFGEKLLHPRRVEIQTVEPVDGVEIDRDGQELAVHLREHSMLVRAPLRELREVVDDLLR